MNDPIHRASMHKATGFLWSEVGEMISLSDQDRKILAAARRFGLVEGLTVPVHVPGEYRGTCSFAARSLTSLGNDALPLATMFGAYAFEAGRAIITRTSPASTSRCVPILTERQRDALVLIARGKVDVEIGMLLGISPATAHEHVENLRRAYGNPQRAFLVARALFDGQISYREVFHP
jgi:LuxR family quorum-sensing system transcriptional regulator CciR